MDAFESMGEHQSVPRLRVGAILKEPAERMVYSGAPYGLHGSGEGIKILVIDSGAPLHSALRSSDTYTDPHSVNFTTSSNDRDFLGYSTVVCGIISGNADKLKGYAPDVELFFAKAIDDHANGKFDSIIASVLWGAIKGVDIIVMPVAHSIDNFALHEAIIKAHANNVCVVAPMGLDAATYPAVYPEVLSVGTLVTAGSEKLSNSGDFNINGESAISCYLEESYIKVSGTAIATAHAAGLLALVIEGRKKAKIKFKPNDVYEAVRKLSSPK